MTTGQYKTKKRKIYFAFTLAESKDYFVNNLALLVESGIGMVPALTSIKEESASGRMRRIIGEMIKEVEAGRPLWQTLENSGLFPAQVISLIKIGERSGKLVENLRVVAEEQQKERGFHAKVRSAILYPVLVLVMILTVGTGVIWFILPRLAMVFSSLNIKLPIVTKVMIAAGKFLSHYGLIAVPVFIIAVLLVTYIVFYFAVTKIIGEMILFHTPGIKKLLVQSELARFGYISGTLIEAGMPIVTSLNSLIETTQHKRYKKFYRYLMINIDEGNSFKKSLDNYKKCKKLMPGEIRQLISAGEQSGNLSKVLKKIGADYEEKLETTTKDLAVILEPLLLILVWAGVALIAIAVIMPIYSLVGNLNSGQ